MKTKWAWLMVIYTVIQFSGGWYVQSKTNQNSEGTLTVYTYTYQWGPFEYKEFAEDMASALNEANERRTGEVTTHPVTNNWNVYLSSKAD